MIRKLTPVFVLVFSTLLLSGCLSLSFGGKHVAATPCDCTDDARVSALEARVQSLEQRIAEVPSASGPAVMVNPSVQ